MDEGVFILRNNEKGILIADQLLVLLILLIAGSILLPFCMKIMLEASARWEMQEGMRKLYEQAEPGFFETRTFSYNLDQPVFTGEISWQQKQGKVAACVFTNRKTRCVEEQ